MCCCSGSRRSSRSRCPTTCTASPRCRSSTTSGARSSGAPRCHAAPRRGRGARRRPPPREKNLGVPSLGGRARYLLASKPTPAPPHPPPPPPRRPLGSRTCLSRRVCPHCRFAPGTAAYVYTGTMGKALIGGDSSLPWYGYVGVLALLIGVRACGVQGRRRRGHRRAGGGAATAHTRGRAGAPRCARGETRACESARLRSAALLRDNPVRRHPIACAERALVRRSPVAGQPPSVATLSRVQSARLRGAALWWKNPVATPPVSVRNQPPRVVPCVVRGQIAQFLTDIATRAVEELEAAEALSTTAASTPEAKGPGRGRGRR